MTPATLAHLSDLHLGQSPRTAEVAAALVAALLERRVDHVLVTGDVTHRGRHEELTLFCRIFAPLLGEGRVSLVPGNHDRVGQDAGRVFMGDARVDALACPGLHVVRVDSTGAHNRSYLAAHGLLTAQQLEEVEAALEGAPADAFRVVMLHHHPLPLPEESLQERLASRLGWPHAAELPLGAGLVRRCLGRADLLLHGHRHVPWARDVEALNGRTLRVSNAGSSTERAGFQLYRYADGARLGEPEWVPVAARGAAHPSPGRALWTALQTASASLF
jgi:3',5'-cyclic AMP phosphodiesterase CpdA